MRRLFCPQVPETEINTDLTEDVIDCIPPQ